MSWRVYAAGALVAVALLWSMSGRKPEPTPAPPAPDGLNLRGQFIGPSAASDAAMLAALCGELAEVIEWDGMQDAPRLKSGVAFDELRVAAREARCRGESIGHRQPHVRKALEDFLVQRLGVSGGPIGPQERAKWVAAYRELARACSDASR